MALRQQIHLPKIRKNAERIRDKTNGPLIAVVKSNAYGLGAKQVIETLRDVVEGFYFFSLSEVLDVKHMTRGKDVIALNADGNQDVDAFKNADVRPVVWTVESARHFSKLNPVLAVDTGQQRFAADADTARRVLDEGLCVEAMTHASTPEQVQQFLKILDGRSVNKHAAGSSLLQDPTCYLDAVRPGLALYENAVTVTTPLVDVRQSTGPMGYKKVTSATGRHGVILAGYSDGLRPGPCEINGTRRRVLEVGMQSAFVEVGEADRPHDPVMLLGASVSPAMVAAEWNVTQQEVLVRLLSATR